MFSPFVSPIGILFKTARAEEWLHWLYWKRGLDGNDFCEIGWMLWRRIFEFIAQVKPYTPGLSNPSHRCVTTGSGMDRWLHPALLEMDQVASPEPSVHTDTDDIL